LSHRFTEIEASLIKALAHPSRLRVIGVLARGPLGVGILARELGLAPAAASQHLSAMRTAGLVTARREGRTVRYALADPEILAACELVRGVIDRRLATALTHVVTAPSQVIHA
jgi:DNA-binding transcriptional ArsR family regulator